MTLHLSEKEAAAFFAQIKRPMPVSPKPVHPVIKPEQPQRAPRPARAPTTATKHSRLSYALGYSSVTARAVRPQVWVALAIVAWLLFKAFVG